MKAKTEKMTQKMLKKLFTYNKQKGRFIRKTATVGAFGKIGQMLDGTISTAGYRLLKIKNVQYSYSRLIFLFHHGYIPFRVSFKNSDRSDVRLTNLIETRKKKVSKKVTKKKVAKKKRKAAKRSY